MSTAFQIRLLTVIGADESGGLSDVLMDCVEGGASVSFMAPLSREKAKDYWQSLAPGVARGERLVLVAEDSTGTMIGTTSVILDLPENQPHRGDLAKMLVHRRARGCGVGAALLVAAERCAQERGRSLLVLDTASDTAERLYVRHGWQRCGTIPAYALMPDGQPCATTIYYKFLPPRTAGPVA